MSLERNIGDYVKEKGITLSAMSRATGISYMALYDSLANEKKTRQLRGRELIAVSDFLGINPKDFSDREDEKGA